MKEVVIDILRKALNKIDVKLKKEQIEKILEIPPSQEMGDYAFPCFFLSEKLKQGPHEIALEIREKIKNFPETDFEDIQTSGGYINFFENRKDLARKAVWDIITKKEKYGKQNIGKQKKIIIEFSSPNIGKPFGIGQLRSTIIGNSISNIYKFVGFKPIRINYLGDWGTQFGKLILGYEKFGSENKLHKNAIKHLLEIYVKINKNKKYEKEAREWFKKLEDKNKEAVILWRAFKELSMEEFEKIYKILDITFDNYSGEFEASKMTKEVLEKLNEKNLLKKSEGALIVDLNEFNLGVCIIQKSDGATTYATRDIATAINRYKKYKFNKMIYEVGQEQKLHFRQIFKVMELMGYKWTKDCIHVSHGLYLGNDRKKFATRKGKTIFMEDIINKTQTLAKKEIKKRTPKINKKELDKRSLIVAIAAIFYGDLKNNRVKDIIFDLERFVSFEGDTGPYIQYSYARATSILNKTENNKKFIIKNLHPKEIELVKKLLDFQNVISNSYKTLNPSLIANYSYQLSQIFNEFYHSCPVIGSEEESFRLALVESFRQVLKNASKLLGFNLLEKM
jgi:arginyl-tRNA synthetase